MTGLVRDSRFYRTFFRLTAVIALQNLIYFSVNLADNIMLGSYDEGALAGAALVGQVHYLLQMIAVNGIGAGALVMVSQYWGKRDTEAIRRIFSIAAKFSVGFGLLFFFFTFLWPDTILFLLTNDPAVREAGVSYLHFVSFSFLAFPLQSALVMALRGVETTVIGPVICLCSLAMKIVLNYTLIFGNFGAPELGIVGAGISTLVSRFAELIVLLIYLKRFDKKLKISFHRWLLPDGAYLGDFFKTAIPLIASGASWGVGIIMQSVILGHMSSAAVAANSISTVMQQITTVFAFASCHSSSVMIGKIIGEGRMDLIRPYSRTFQLLFIANGIVTGLLVFLLRDFILGFYQLSASTHELARGFMTVLSATLLFTCYEYPVQNGIVAGGGDTKYPFFVDTLFIWLFTIPFSALSAFVWQFPPLVTFLFLKGDQILKCIPNTIKVNRYRWVRVLTRTSPCSGPSSQPPEDTL
jgi:putative MATE family efflux protein